MYHKALPLTSPGGSDGNHHLNGRQGELGEHFLRLHLYNTGNRAQSPSPCHGLSFNLGFNSMNKPRISVGIIESILMKDEFLLDMRGKVKVLVSCSCVTTPWTIAHQAPLYTEFSKKEYWSGYHSILQGIFLIQGLNLVYCITGIFFTV